uniref:Uncharacterized protein n=1 Tax=Picea glauca TaxID=3330 RepID=A0A101LWJ5_PICGL|nr:hypothetical protein ABT39_MTgene1341 [Picea glauca]
MLVQPTTRIPYIVFIRSRGYYAAAFLFRSFCRICALYIVVAYTHKFWDIL